MCTCLETGFVICDDPQVAEIAYNRHKYINRLLCWISPQLLYTSILNKQKTTDSALPLRVLTATLADRVSSLINPRHLTSPSKYDPRDYYDNSNSTLASPDPLVALRNSVYWQSSPGESFDWPSGYISFFSSTESPSTNLSDCSRYLNDLEREALDLSTASHNRSLNDCKFVELSSSWRLHLPRLAYCRSPIMSTNAMNDTVAELRSRPYQMAHVRSATSHNGSTVVDDDARKSDYKRIVGSSAGAIGTNPSGSTTTTVVRVRLEHLITRTLRFPSHLRARCLFCFSNGAKYVSMVPNCSSCVKTCAK